MPPTRSTPTFLPRTLTMLGLCMALHGQASASRPDLEGPVSPLPQDARLTELASALTAAQKGQTATFLAELRPSEWQSRKDAREGKAEPGPFERKTELAAAESKNLLDKEPNVKTEVAVAERKSLLDQMRDKASDMVIMSMNFLGVPYKWGGDTAQEGFDCSGFTRYMFEHSIGLVLPRRAEEQARAPGLQTVSKAELRPGDLVFFNTLRSTFSHVGIYVGEGKFIHAPRTGSEVRVDDMEASYWTRRFTGARRAGDGATSVAVSAMAINQAPSELQPRAFTRSLAAARAYVRGKRVQSSR